MGGEEFQILTPGVEYFQNPLVAERFGQLSDDAEGRHVNDRAEVAGRHLDQLQAGHEPALSHKLRVQGDPIAAAKMLAEAPKAVRIGDVAGCLAAHG